jgi:hypothetical protein
MANLFVNVPVPAGNGSGAPVDMSAFSYSKTLSVTGTFVAAVTLEISNELVPTKWAPLLTFNRPDGIVMDFACRWLRASVAGYKSGAPSCDVGGTDDGTVFASLPATPSNGIGAAVDVSALPLFKTVTVGGPFAGNVQIEVSEDGITDWSQIGFGFQNPGYQTQIFAARFMRVVRAGVNLAVAAGLPIVDIAACTTGDGAIGPPGPPGPPGPSSLNPMALPEQWAVEAVPAATGPADMSCQVSTNFDDLQTMRAGSIVGLSARLTAAIAVGSIDVQVMINGFPTGPLVTLPAGPTSISTTPIAGAFPYAAGDMIGMRYTSSADLAPADALNLEAWLEVIEVTL